MSKSVFQLLSQAKFWGSSPVQASRETPGERKLEVFRSSSEGRELVGRLSLEDGQFVFRYVEEYQGEPISAFPKIDREYRSDHLWPFFSVRIPPLSRDDMRDEVKSQVLDEGDTLQILGSIAKTSVTNPYEFVLAGGC